jgi:hypothetical protein
VWPLARSQKEKRRFGCTCLPFSTQSNKCRCSSSRSQSPEQQGSPALSDGTKEGCSSVAQTDSAVQGSGYLGARVRYRAIQGNVAHGCSDGLVGRPLQDRIFCASEQFTVSTTSLTHTHTYTHSHTAVCGAQYGRCLQFHSILPSRSVALYCASDIETVPVAPCCRHHALCRCCDIITIVIIITGRTV